MTARSIAPTLAALALLAAAPAWAQSAPPTTGGANSTPPSSTTPMTGGTPVDRSATTGSGKTSRDAVDQKPWRASKVIGADVYGADNKKIGSIDDLLVSESGEMTAVLSVGGFLGIGDKLVTVPYGELKHAEHWMLPGADEESLKGRPEFRYADNSKD